MNFRAPRWTLLWAITVCLVVWYVVKLMGVEMP